MPNWCSNSITIQGPTDTLKQLWDDAQTGHKYQDDDGNTVEEFGLLNAMVPQPDFDSVTDLSEGMPDWWTWRVSNWGTKWDISDEGLEFTDNGDGTSEITGWFDSAWAPPIEAYNAFLDDMDNCSITASYHEPGMDFAGFYTDGEEEHLEGVRDEYELAEDERSDLYNRLDEEYGLSADFAMWDEEDEE